MYKFYTIGHKTECPYKYCNLEAIRVSKEWSKMKTKLDIRIAKVGKIKVLNKAPIAPNKSIIYYNHAYLN